MNYEAIIGCEESGVIRDALRWWDIDAISCDLKPTSTPGPHLQCDIFAALAIHKPRLLVCHPECTYLCNSGLHWNKRRPGRAQLTKDAIAFAEALWEYDGMVVLENPVGVLSTQSKLGKPDVIIQPYMFGDDASKATCLWFKGLPPIKIPPRETWHPGRKVMWMTNEVTRWANQTDSGQNKLPPSKNRAELRSKTYPKFAAALAAHIATHLRGK